MSGRCPACGTITPSGSNCLLTDTDWYEWTAGTDGTVDDPHTLDPILSADVDQLLTCGAGGLLAVMPTTLSNPPAVQAYNTTNLSIANNTLTIVTLNTELYDTDTMHSTSSNTGRITFTTAGVYAVTSNMVWNKNATGDRLALIRKNGTDVLTSDVKGTGGADLLVGHCLTLIDNFSATDYIETLVHQTSGAALLLLSDSYSPVFTATRMA